MFTKKDLFVLVPTGLMTVLAILSSLSIAKTGETPWAYVAVWGTVVILLCVCLYVTYQRWSALQRIDFTTKHGIQVDTATFIVTQHDMEIAIDNFIELWKEKVPNIQVLDYLNGLYIVLREQPFKTPKGAQVIGLAWLTKDMIELSWMPRLEDTALFHELGHMCYYKHTKNVLESTYQAWAKEVGVP